MFQTIYIEEGLQKHPRVQYILNLIKPENIIEIQKYTDVFNRKNQNFRLQKESGQKLIIAKKKDNFIQGAPEKCKLGIEKSYYFSHLYNCPFDCEYCYLQSTYRSANFVLFINYEDYFQEITKLDQEDKLPKYFFSGFDCDSLALESITNFTKDFIPFFETLSNSSLELRTKSSNLSFLETIETPKNSVLAWTLTPEVIQQKYESKTAPLEKRIEAIQKMSHLGWRIGLRFEPMLYIQKWQEIYSAFFDKLIQEIDFSKIEDVNIGTLHLPKDMHKAMRKLRPQSKLFAGPFELDTEGEMRYFKQINQQMKDLAFDKLKKVINQSRIFVV